MARSDNDSWDIAQSVGSTALGAAAARASASAEPDPLINDPFAQLFLDAARQSIWKMWSSPPPDNIVEREPEVSARMQAMVDYVACRTVFFDRLFADAADAGVRQAVILASGLDARAWRLPWAEGTRVYELDQPKVLQFKSSTLQRAGALPRAQLVNVAVDLRQDWPKALQNSGFNPSTPTAWSAEGLLMFLPAKSQDLLFERIHALSAPGSRVAVEALSSERLEPGFLRRQIEHLRRFREAAVKLADNEVPDLEQLWYLEERSDVADWLASHGWDVTVHTADELMAAHQRSVPENIQHGTPRHLFVSAQLPGPAT
jgi:methyltransferase (TIGR00027 family)